MLTQLIQWAADAIVQRQRPDGALLMEPADQSANSVIPYFANLAVIGLANAYPHLRRRSYLHTAQKWLQWYASHMNPDGTIHDYQLLGGELRPTGDCDSTDAYAATFLEALERTAQVSGERRWWSSLYPAAVKAVGAIRLTLQADGLTWAKPGRRVKYLMDNVEVFRGWRSARWIAHSLGRGSEAAEWERQAHRTLAAIDRWLFLPREGWYAWALHEDGTRESGLSQWYPDVMAQLMAIAWLPASTRRKRLFAQLQRQFAPMWQTAMESGDVGALVWWGMAAMGAGDRAFAQRVVHRLAESGAKDAAAAGLAVWGHVLRLCSEWSARR